jgi:transcriptional regulator with XRE-family HTH domain
VAQRYGDGPGISEFGRFVRARLRQERRLAGATREALGAALGISADAIEQCESSGALLTAHQLAAAAASLGVTLSALFYDGGRRAAAAAERSEHLRWIAIRRPARFLSRPDFAPLAPVLAFWQERRGYFSDDVGRSLSAGGILDRAILVRRRPGASRLGTEHFGAAFMFLRPSDIVGRGFEAQPDREYADWMVDAYNELLDERAPGLRVEACRAIIHAWDGRTICARYDRVLIPWRSHGVDQFAMCVSLRRGEPTVVPSDMTILDR